MSNKRPYFLRELERLTYMWGRSSAHEGRQLWACVHVYCEMFEVADLCAKYGVHCNTRGLDKISGKFNVIMIEPKQWDLEE